MSLEQFFPWLERLGIGAVFALMWWMERKEKLAERKERLRMQSLVESYLPVITSTARVQKALHKVVIGDDGED